MLEDNLRRLFSIIFFLITIVIILLAVLTNPQIYSGLPRKNEKVRNLIKMKCYIFTVSLLYSMRHKVVVILIIKNVFVYFIEAVSYQRSFIFLTSSRVVDK